MASAFIVQNGEDITLKLGGYTLTNAAGSDTIYVEMGGKLTIEGEGKVVNNTADYAALFNNGTVVINGGTFELGNNNQYYVILNHGVMTINDALVQVNSTGSSLVENGYIDYTSENHRRGYVEGTNHSNPTLTINGGTFTGGMNTIKNDDGSILTINDGTFTNSYQVSVMNWNVATINGGTFNTPTGLDKTNIFVRNYGTSVQDKGILIINGGTFNAEYTVEGNVTTAVEVNGGYFNYTKGFVNDEFIYDNLTETEPIVKGGLFPTDSIKIAEGYTKYQISENDFLVLETIDFDTKEEDITLTVGDKLTINVDDFVEYYGVFTSSDEKVASIDGNVVTAEKVGESTITVEFNGETKVINLTVVEKKEETKNEDKIITPPNTGDNVLTYFVISMASVAGLVACRRKLRKQEN